MTYCWPTIWGMAGHLQSNARCEQFCEYRVFFVKVDRFRARGGADGARAKTPITEMEADRCLGYSASPAVFAKEAGAGVGGDGQVWPGEQHVGWARRVLGDQRHCARTPSFGLGA